MDRVGVDCLHDVSSTLDIVRDGKFLDFHL